MNNYNNPNRRNNNQRRNSRGGSGKQNGRNGGGSRPRNFDDENISPQQKRHFINKRDTHLARAKEMRANGDRIEAENEFQHAEHFTRMIKIADEQQEKFNARKAAERPEGGNNQASEASNNENAEAKNDADADIVYDVASDENPQAENSEKKAKFVKKRPLRTKPAREQNTDNDGEATTAEIAELPFMQPVEKPVKKAE